VPKAAQPGAVPVVPAVTAKYTVEAAKPAPAPKPAAAAAAAPRAQQQRQQQRQKLTVPQSPALRLKYRAAASKSRQTKTTEQMEMDEVRRGREEATRLRERNARTVRVALRPPPPAPVAAARPVARRPTEPRAPNLRTSTRQREHSMSTRSMVPAPQQLAGRKRPAPGAAPKPAPARPAPAQLTLPRSPRFATTTRLRPSRFKPSEQEEEDKMAKLPKFKARPVKCATQKILCLSACVLEFFLLLFLPCFDAFFPYSIDSSATNTPLCTSAARASWKVPV
jgi:hypothetical protein